MLPLCAVCGHSADEGRSTRSTVSCHSSLVSRTANAPSTSFLSLKLDHLLGVGPLSEPREYTSFLGKPSSQQPSLNGLFFDPRKVRIPVEGRESRTVSGQRIPFGLQLEKFRQHFFSLLGLALQP